MQKQYNHTASKDINRKLFFTNMLIIKPIVRTTYNIIALYTFSTPIGISCNILRMISVCNKNKQIKINQNKIFKRPNTAKKTKLKTLPYFLSIFANKLLMSISNIVCRCNGDDTTNKEISKSFHTLAFFLIAVERPKSPLIYPKSRMFTPPSNRKWKGNQYQTHRIIAKQIFKLCHIFLCRIP